MSLANDLATLVAKAEAELRELHDEQGAAASKKIDFGFKGYIMDSNDQFPSQQHVFQSIENGPQKQPWSSDKRPVLSVSKSKIGKAIGIDREDFEMKWLNEVVNSCLKLEDDGDGDRTDNAFDDHSSGEYRHFSWPSIDSPTCSDSLHRPWGLQKFFDKEATFQSPGGNSPPTFHSTPKYMDFKDKNIRGKPIPVLVSSPVTLPVLTKVLSRHQTKVGFVRETIIIHSN